MGLITSLTSQNREFGPLDWDICFVGGEKLYLMVIPCKNCGPICVSWGCIIQ